MKTKSGDYFFANGNELKNLSSLGDKVIKSYNVTTKNNKKSISINNQGGEKMNQDISYSREEKLEYYGDRMNDPKLEDGQRNYAKKRYQQIFDGNDYPPYSLEEKRKYHSMRAKKNSVDPISGKKFQDTQRSRSRGYLQALKNLSKAFKYKNPEYKRKTK